MSEETANKLRWLKSPKYHPVDSELHRVVFLMKDGSYKLASDSITPVGLIDKWAYLPDIKTGEVVHADWPPIVLSTYVIDKLEVAYCESLTNAIDKTLTNEEE